MNQVEFGRLVAQKRKELGLSQLELGKKLQIPEASNGAIQKAISNIENGTSTSRGMIVSLCRFLKVKPVPDLEIVPWNPINTKGLFEPTATEDDISLISQNLSLQEHLNTIFSRIIQEECEKFRTFLDQIKKSSA